MIGNTYKKSTFTVGGRAERVWREIRHRYPSGGTISNLSAFANAGIIKSGSPVKFDMEAKTITVITDAQLTSAADAAAVAALGINGYLQEDVYIGDASVSDMVASGTVVYDGELYEYMYDASVLAKLKLVTTTPRIVFVQ